MTSFDKLADYDISRIKLLTDFSYDDALIGVTEDSRAIYDYDKMVKWLIEEEKIDGAVATIMGLDRAIRCGNNTGASVYDERGILFI